MIVNVRNLILTLAAIQLTNAVPAHAVVIDVSGVEFTSLIPNPIAPGGRPTSFSYAFDYDKETNATVNAGFSFSIYFSLDPTLDTGTDIFLGTLNGGAGPVGGISGHTTATTSNPNGITTFQVPASTTPGQYHAFLAMSPRAPHTDPDNSDAFGLLAGLVTVMALPNLLGDYNDDHVVDAADYSVWRDNLGSSATLPNDSTPGSVTDEDYGVWKANFGLSAAAIAASERLGRIAPEPGAIALAGLAGITLAGRIFRRRRAS